MQILFYILFSVTPLILWPRTSELFEFNKMIFVYIMTVLISAVWLTRCIAAKKLIFRRTLLDIPLLIFLGSQILSTIFSIDHRTSFFGYYSRFNGGLLSVISYSLLYWAFVSNMNTRYTLYAIRYTLISALLVSTIAFLEHFNINITCALMGQGLSSCWIQDVQNRVFSTLGQPNWLATYLVALMPIGWAFALKSKKLLLFYSFTLLLYTTLLFTKSRSGILGFVFADLIFWGYILIKYKKQFLVQAIVHNSLFIVLAFVISSPFTVHRSLVTPPTGPALETGGTESGTIRKIVWKGAIQVWRNFPIIGSGPETFAFSYYKFRPVEHNLVSEWDFLYNKAHNEYLNLAATTGTLGILSYLYLIGMIYLVFFKKLDIFSISLAAGFTGILVSNFFGFSTVSTQLEFFLFPAFAITLGISGQRTGDSQKIKLNNTQKIFIVLSLFAITYSLYAICKYWYADTLYAKGGIANLQKAIILSPKEAIFHSKLAEAYLAEKNSFDLAISESNKAVDLSPANVNLLRNQAGIYLKLAIFDPKYLGSAKNTLLKAIVKAPTDAKLLYNLALIYMRTGEADESIKLLKKVIEMKSNYKEAKDLLNIIHKTF